MLFNALILALSASIDSLGVGITYGIKRTKISYLAILVLFLLSFFITSLSIIFGNILTSFISPDFTTIIGGLMLFAIGSFFIYSSLKSEKVKISPNKIFKHTEYNFIINFLGITVKIIRNPINSDFDNSNKIDFKEAIFLGLALSLDSISIGFAASTIGVNSFVFPLLISFFQIIFLCTGKFFGIQINRISKIPNNIWNIVSGGILIFIGLSKIL